MPKEEEKGRILWQFPFPEIPLAHLDAPTLVGKSTLASSQNQETVLANPDWTWLYPIINKKTHQTRGFDAKRESPDSVGKKVQRRV
ncbi:MAG: hypothetical protein PHW53_02755 [Patescibacteria group bacterium]|nr:hypothetical protein [Patescibacteria group bacterium]